MLIIVYHFWYETKSEDVSWSNIKKIIKACAKSEDFARINRIINENIFSKPEYDKACKSQLSYYKELKEYRNNLYAHITIADTPALTKKGNTTYFEPQNPNPNILLHLGNFIKIISNIFGMNDDNFNLMLYQSIHMTPNLYFVSGGSCYGVSTYCLKNSNEINLFYFIPENWKIPFWF